MNIGLEILSDLTIFAKYAKYKQGEERRENWDEIVDRYRDMMIKRYPNLKDAIMDSISFIREKKVLPSMRALQFAGIAAEVNNARIYNCCFLPVDSIHSFSETMFLLLGGTGVGYSVQNHHIEKLPSITKPGKARTYLIEDSIMGWGDAVKVLMKAYLEGKFMPIYDFRAIRQKGARLVTAGGKAPGPEPLKLCLINIQTILDRKKPGEKLTDIECHDIQGHIANSVLSGGIRRSAMISLFDLSSTAMINCKSSSVESNIISKVHPTYTTKDGLSEDLTKYILTIEQEGVIYKDIVIHKDLKSDKFWDLEQYGYDGTLGWWVCNEQRGRANNSAVLERGVVTESQFKELWKKIEESKSGEPGTYWTHNKDWGTNP